MNTFELAHQENKNTMMKKSDYIIAILFALALAGAYAIYQPFLLSMVVALLLTMATANVHLKITNYIHSENISSIILSLLLFLILFVPIIYIMTIGFIVGINKSITGQLGWKSVSNICGTYRYI